jgi:hypothetical protein
MTTETGSGEAGASSGRQRPLSDAAERFRRMDLRNTWQVAAGAVLVPLGIVIVLLAWYGSAHTPYVQGQIPYLVSGSFIGLGLMVVGGLMYWAHWLYRIYDQADLHQTEQAQRDRQLFDLLEALLARDPVGVSRAGRAVRPASPANNAPVTNGLVATASGSNVHRPECPIVARHRSGVRSLSAVEVKGRTPCRICQPDLS